MTPCVYTTNAHRLLEYAAAHAVPTDVICFSSDRRWGKAADYVAYGSIPILLAPRSENGTPSPARYHAELTEVRFADSFGSEKKRRKWLEAQLWMQRMLHAHDGHAPESFNVLEIDHYLIAATHYLVRNLKRIHPVAPALLVEVKEETGDVDMNAYFVGAYPAKAVRALAPSGG